MDDDAAYYQSLGPWLDEEAGSGGLLAVEFADGRLYYPSWQFKDGLPLPGLDRVIQALQPGFVAPASQAGWLSKPAFVDGSKKRWQFLAEGEVDLVVGYATEDAERVTRR